MCGIMGYIGRQNAASVLVNGLRRLEYRGYDSAGVAVLTGGGLEVRRAVGKLPALEEVLRQNPVLGRVGLGHTRWATHGRPTEANAHPHSGCDGRIAVVHNGIIENYMELKMGLAENGHVFKSQTDTEVLAHLIEEEFRGDLLEAVQKALKKVQGSYALGVMCSTGRDSFVAARKESPLVLGVTGEETLLASDVSALLPHTRKVIFLNDGEIAELTQDQARIFDREGRGVTRSLETVTWDAAMAEKGGFPHYMLKEITEQGRSIRETIGSAVSLEEGRVKLEDVLPAAAVEGLSKICLVGCGTSYHAALVARSWMEELAKIPCSVEIASEYRYRRGPEEKNVLIVAVTQSGETADTMAALRSCKAKGLPTLALCNVVGSSAAREAAYALFTRCGPEIGVASTKAFTAQLAALFLLALYIGQCRGRVTPDFTRPLLHALTRLPAAIDEIVARSGEIEEVAKRFYQKKAFLYIGRQLNYPIALEGALKLKEISYIYSEGYAAGEMKHGPIALIDEDVPVIAIATASSVREKMLANMEEVRARGGPVIAVAADTDEEARSKADAVLPVPATWELLSPILNIIPLQLLAYHIALLRGCDVDQPRNLAKSVTVE